MIYSFSLQTVGIVVGLLLVASHAFALAAPAPTQNFLRALPRSRFWGTVLLAISAVWAFWLVRTMDLGEFARLRGMLTIAVPVGAVLAWQFVDEFLAVRALGILCLLAAEPPLEAAFLRPEVSRLLLVTLAYAWILAGLFLVGMPYVLRDLIAWATSRQNAWRGLAMVGILWGIALVACGIALW
jgi:hypothetical protein